MKNFDIIYQFRRDSKENWLKANPILLDRELILVATDPFNPFKYDNIKVGDGISKFSELPYLYDRNSEPSNPDIPEIPSDLEAGLHSIPTNGGTIIQEMIGDRFAYKLNRNEGFILNYYEVKEKENSNISKGFSLLGPNYTINPYYAVAAYWIPFDENKLFIRYQDKDSQYIDISIKGGTNIGDECTIECTMLKGTFKSFRFSDADGKGIKSITQNPYTFIVEKNKNVVQINYQIS